MKITSVNVRKIEKEGSRMKGIASVLLDDSFAVHDIRIIEGEKGLFIAMPSKKTPTGDYRDIAHPINIEVNTILKKEILKSYEKVEEQISKEEKKYFKELSKDSFFFFFWFIYFIRRQ